LPVFTNVTEFVHPCWSNDHHYPRMQLNFSTFVQETITPIQECNQILITSKNNHTYPRMRSNFNKLGEQSPLFKSVTKFVHPYPDSDGSCLRSATKFQSPRWTIVCPSHYLERCRLNFNHFFNKLQLIFGHVKMMGNFVLISFNPGPLTKLNISINWSLPSYCINFLTFLSLPQWVPNLWLFFAINARNFNVHERWERNVNMLRTTRFLLLITSTLQVYDCL
jgi:hypothetical protein